ncbi:MAG TPA: RluA family pseudouridine synthase [Spirochaetia bacterium]|nr:RluA family pseudouridine synthase [Spirochaetia bacterium]
MSSLSPAPSSFVALPEHQGLKADAFLALAIPSLSRTRIRQKIQTGESLLNGRRFASCARLAPGDVVTVLWRNAPAFARSRELDILYEDEDIVAVDKPAGIASHPTGRFQSDTVIQFVRERFAADMRASLIGAGDFFPRLVNRLDVLTSGVILVAKTTAALRPMQEMVSGGKIGKRYIALVEGRIERNTWRIDLPLGPDPSSSIRLRMAPREGGLASVTDCTVMERFHVHTLVKVFPRTGRQHQIRAHLAAVGHPVWGDLLYNNEALFLRYLRLVAGSEPPGGDVSVPRRHCLHAEEVEFAHPLTGARVLIRSPLPSDFVEILRGIEPTARHDAPPPWPPPRFASPLP